MTIAANKTGQPFLLNGNSTLGLEVNRSESYDWLTKLRKTLKLIIENPHYQVVGGPSTFTMYITALYFCMTCMTSIGFGNVAADTDNEKVRFV